jgi:hypothetical protein
VIVITGASAGTDAAVSAAAGGFAGADCGGTLWACIQASVPIKTHSTQLIRMTLILRDWSTRKVKIPSRKS